MQNSGPLVFLGLAIIATTAIAILVPYLRRTSDILSAWNIFLLGGSMFMGVGCLAVAYGDFHWPELQWFQPSQSDVRNYVLGAVTFYGTLYLCYFWFSWPKRLVANFMNKWPPMSNSFLIFCVAVFVLLAFAALATHGIPILSSLFFNISHKAIVFGVVFTFCHWYQDKRKLPLLLLFLGMFAFAGLFAMVEFRGRRLLLSVAVAPLICMYWLHWRYLPPLKNVMRLGFATLLAFTVTVVYSSFRHFDAAPGEFSARTFGSTIQALKTVQLDKAFEYVRQNMFFYFSQYCTHYSLLTIQLVDNGQIEVEPLNTLAFLAAYPVPRVLWENKPQALGGRMVTEVLRLPYRTNWGLGIVGNCYHEGGLPVVVLYAVLMVLGIRVLDDALVRQPNNVFLLGILCTSAPHFAALIRGDPTNMSAEIIESFAFAWGLGLIGRFLFGTSVVTGTTRVTPPGNPSAAGRMRQPGR